MTLHAAISAATSTPSTLVKADPTTPALVVTAHDGIAIKAGTTFHGRTFERETKLGRPTLEPGNDYAVTMLADGDLEIVPLTSAGIADCILGGFHFAPGGNAAARAGGDTTPQINPCSLWDLNFRPACPDPRGMALVDGLHGHRFWVDIYLLGVDHLRDGTSKCGATIADGSDCPVNPATGKKFARLEYEHAVAVMAHHGKQLMSYEEFAAAAIGVTEKSACGRNPKTTGLDAPRTSRFGLMQATGNMWIWGHDGDPDTPRASIWGGSWLNGGRAGSRCANLGYWPGVSVDNIGARGRSDHLQLA